VNQETEAVTGRSRVVDPAGLQARSPGEAVICNLITGTLAGLMLATGGVVLQAVTRTDSVDETTSRCASGRLCALSLEPLAAHLAPATTLRRHLEAPSSAVSLFVHHLRRVIAGSTPRSRR
jgi:ABC-type Fe3+-siderophore transport system permease subunit